MISELIKINFQLIQSQMEHKQQQLNPVAADCPVRTANASQENQETYEIQKKTQSASIDQ